MENRHIYVLLLLAGIIAAVRGQEGQAYCPDDSQNAVDFAYRCVQHLVQAGTSVPTSLMSSLFWPQLCQSWYNLPGCIQDVYERCPDNFITRIQRAAVGSIQKQWRDRSFFPYMSTCNGTGGVRENVTELYENPGQYCQDAVFGSFAMCMEDWIDKIQYSVESKTGRSSATFPNDTEALVLSMFRCTIGNIVSPCAGPESYKLAHFLLRQMVPAQLLGPIQGQDLRNNYENNEIFSLYRATVGVFGDPHVQAFRRDSVVTCEAAGQYNYMKNAFFNINATGTHVTDETSRATALTEVVLRFYNGDGMVVFSYRASGGNLPDNFNNRQSTGMAGDHLVVITASSSSHVTITINSLAIVIDIRRWNAHYTVAVRMSTLLVDRSSGILKAGCPRDQVINRQSRRRRALRPGECEDACSGLNNTDSLPLRDTCMYDCLTTSNPKIAVMSEQYVEAMNALEAADGGYDLVDTPGFNAATIVYPVLTLPLAFYHLMKHMLALF